MTQTILSALDELKQYKQWMACDAYKAPLNIKTGGHAKWANPNAHCSFSDMKQVVAQQSEVFKGYGFILTPTDPFVVLDFDHCIQNGKIDEDIREIILKLNSYAEVSPNKAGVHLWIRGKLKHALVAKPFIDGVEAYGCSNHFITVTENHVGNTPFTIEDRQSELDEFILAIEAKRKQCQKVSNTLQKHIHELGNMAIGGRNTELAKVAWLAGKFIAEYGLRENAIEAAIYDACEKNGLSLDEPEQTKRSYESQLAAGKAAAGTNNKPPAPPKPRIELGEQLDIEVDAVLRELYNANNPPVIFNRGGTLAKVGRDEDGRPEIKVVDEQRLLNRVARVADFFKFSETKSEWINAHPPLKDIKLILAQDTWLFPPLSAITEIPTLVSDYIIHATPGYNELSHSIYIPQPGLRIPKPLTRPTQDDAKAAAKRAFSYIAEFPYADDASFANMCGLLLTIVTRHLYPLVPLQCISALKAGTGKGYLHKLVTLLATGRIGGTMDMPEDEREMGLRLTGILMRNAMSVFTLDNIDRPIKSAILEEFLTTEYWQHRILTTPYTPILHQKTIALATGNVLQIGSKEMKRRVSMIELDAGVSEPHLRTGPLPNTKWTYDPLLECVRRDRGQIIIDLLTIAQAWYTAESPKGEFKTSLSDDFGAWARIIGSMLDFVGIPDFLANTKNIADIESEQWLAFYSVWVSHYGQTAFTARELVEKLNNDQDFIDVLPDALSGAYHDERKKPNFHTTLGRVLGKRLQVPYGHNNVCVDKLPPDHGNIARFFITRRQSARVARVARAFSSQLENLLKNEDVLNTHADTSQEKIKNLADPKSVSQLSQVSQTTNECKHISTDSPIGMVQPMTAPEPPSAHVVHRSEDPFAGN